MRRGNGVRGGGSARRSSQGTPSTQGQKLGATRRAGRDDYSLNYGWADRVYDYVQLPSGGELVADPMGHAMAGPRHRLHQEVLLEVETARMSHMRAADGRVSPVLEGWYLD